MEQLKPRLVKVAGITKLPIVGTPMTVATPCLLIATLENPAPGNHVRLAASIDGAPIAKVSVRNEKAETAAALAIPIPPNSTFQIEGTTEGRAQIETTLIPFPVGTVIGKIEEITRFFDIENTAATDGIVVAYASTIDPKNHVRLNAYVANSIIAASSVRNEVADAAGCISFPVRAGETWRVALDGAEQKRGMFFFPLTGKVKIGARDPEPFGAVQSSSIAGLAVGYISNGDAENHVRMEARAPAGQVIARSSVRNEAADEATSLLLLLDPVSAKDWEMTATSEGKPEMKLSWLPLEKA